MSNEEAVHITILEPALLIVINQRFEEGMSEYELYDATRHAWVIGERRKQVKYAYAVYDGIVQQVYRVDKWEQVPARKPEHQTKDRWGFRGEIAEEYQHHVGGNVRRYLQPPSQNPIRYVNID